MNCNSLPLKSFAATPREQSPKRRCPPSDEEWESCKGEIYQIYVEENKTLTTTMRTMKEKHQLNARWIWRHLCLTCLTNWLLFIVKGHGKWSWSSGNLVRIEQAGLLRRLMVSDFRYRGWVPLPSEANIINRTAWEYYISSTTRIS